MGGKIDNVYDVADVIDGMFNQPARSVSEGTTIGRAA